jgi:hypothetical protein
MTLLTMKPLLIGLHLGFAILGIDAFLWLLGEIVGNATSIKRKMYAAVLGLFGYTLTWIIGGYYYVVFYGPLVKPVIKAGGAPWAHAIAMETKEHVFLFAIPMAVTVYFLSRLETAELESMGLKKPFMFLVGLTAALGLSFGLLGFIISAAARWGVI